ncbi:MAG: MarC family protein [Acidobacteria bacterium]|nr:MarC family protein [Acidobacteriota bacterium]
MRVYALTVFAGFFAIMNPIANVPIFLGITADMDKKTRAQIAFRAVALAFIIVALFSIAGKLIFELFGISLPAFRITGGLLVFLIGFHMLQGYHSRVHHPKDSEMEQCRDAALSVAVSPLAMPILAGPGTIATAMSFSAGAGLPRMAITIAVFAVLCGITYVLFRFGEKFVAFIGAGALGVITRMMGLILAVIGTQMVIEGLRTAFHLTSVG